MKRFMYVVLQEKQSLFSLFIGLVVTLIAGSAMYQGHSAISLMVVGASILSLACFSLAVSLHRNKQMLPTLAKPLKAKEA